MRLKHITFTGIDAKTDIRDLQEIQREFPIAEFGVLTSYHWYENGNRYLDPKLMKNLRFNDLRLSLHICGRAAHDAALGKWSDIHYLTWGTARNFGRIQLNIANHKDNPAKVSYSDYGQEIIIQQRDGYHIPEYEATLENWNEYNGRLSVLLDASGGCGINTELKVLPSTRKVGYAGGFNPDNVAEKLTFLMQHVHMGEFWIDMESGVRTDDWFDTDKVVKVLHICRDLLKGMGYETESENR